MDTFHLKLITEELSKSREERNNPIKGVTWLIFSSHLTSLSSISQRRKGFRRVRMRKKLLIKSGHFPIPSLVTKSLVADERKKRLKLAIS
jgi:hypothetical protein